MEVIVFPDPVALAIDVLDANLVDDGAQVGATIPAVARWVTVTLIDSEIRTLVVQRTILRVACQVGEGPTAKKDAQELAQLARAILGSIAGTSQNGTTVYKVSDVHLADDPDQITGLNRVTFNVAISLRGAAVLIGSS